MFLLLLFFGGIILDKFGIRFTGVIATLLMFAGALVKWYAVSNQFTGTIAVPFFGEYQTQVVLASTGFAIFGVGSEICGVTVTKILAKWFTGHEMALAMGVQVALARLGTAAALSASLPFAKMMGSVSASVGLGLALLCAGIMVYLVYCVMDKKEDASVAAVETEPEEGFKFSDLAGLVKTTGFWYVAVLCLMFYAGVFPFLKFATKLMIFKYGVSEDVAGFIPAMLPYGTIILTPLFGSIYDKYGKGATLMLIGSCLLTLVHIVFAPLGNLIIGLLGVGVAYKSGFLNSLFKMIAEKVPRRFLTFMVVFLGILFSMLYEVGYVILIPLAAILFMNIGRHPGAGICAAFSGITFGYGANFIINKLDSTLVSYASKSAKILDSSYVIHLTGNIVFTTVSTILLAYVGMVG